MKIIKPTISSTARVIVAAMSIALASCGNSSEKIVAPEGMSTLDLNHYGKPFCIFVPDTNKSKLLITEQPSGALEIRSGKNFGISINEQAADIDMKKAELKDDEVNKFKSYLKEEPGGIMWESEITQPEYHFILNQKVGNADYFFEDLRDDEGNSFPKAAVEKMYECCKNIKEKHAESRS